MRHIWIVHAKDSKGDVVYLRGSEDEKKAKKYLKECEKIFRNRCHLVLGEFYTLDEGEKYFA
ncbi:hypothetical protein [Saccharolobus solfataricus]|uniref:hypothetical protein n=1 Tax=Saccharolobus solfataricus TaxID=2287 RepID=UPI0001C36D59